MTGFRNTRLSKALQKRTSQTPYKIRDLIGEGEDVQEIDAETGRGYVHRIVEFFEDFNGEDETLIPQLLPSLVLLVHAGADINLRDTDGNTPLHFAFISNAGAKVVNMLMRLGSDLTILNDSKQKVADVIGKSTDPVMVKVLSIMEPGLWQAVETDDYEKTIDMLEKWCKIDCVVDGKSLIERAKELGNESIMNALQNYWPSNQFVWACLTQDMKKMKKITRREQVQIDMKSSGNWDDEGNPSEITLLGECLSLHLFDTSEFLIGKKASINDLIQIGDVKEPLYFHLMKNYSSLMFSPAFTNILDRADFTLVSKFSVGILYAGYQSNWPENVVSTMIERGLDISRRTPEGYTLRDNILVQVAYYPRKKRLEKLQYVDQHVMKLAADGNLDKLKKLADNGYTSLNVARPSGKTAAMVGKKEGHKEVASFLEHAPEFFKNVNALHKYVESANLGKAKEYLNKATCMSKDRAGRSPLHKAVLWERRFVIKYLLKEYSQGVFVRDDYGRTALHYACCLNDAQDIADLLFQAGADDTCVDDSGRTPADYSLNDEISFIEEERNKKCAANIYFLEMYLEIADGIIIDDFDLVRDTKDDLFDDVTLEIILQEMYKPENDTSPSFLQLALEHKRENIGRYLINNGCDFNIQVEYRGTITTLREGLAKAKLERLSEFVEKKFQEESEEEEKFKKMQKALKGQNDEESDENKPKSKSCVVM